MPRETMWLFARGMLSYRRRGSAALPGLFAALAIGSVTLLCGCGPEGQPPVTGLSIWAIGASHDVPPGMSPQRETDCYSHQAKRIRLKGARNEVVACQVVIPAEGEALSGITLRIGGFQTKPAAPVAPTCRAYRSVRCRAVGRFGWRHLRPNALLPTGPVPDALIPIGGQPVTEPFDVAAGTSLPIWLDVRIPARTSPGVYVAPIEVSTSGVVLDRVSLEVQVLPMTLPASASAPIVAGVDMRSVFRATLERDGKPYVPRGVVEGDPMAGKAQGVLDEAMRMLREHGCEPVLYGVYPNLSLDASGKMQLAWETYDRTVSRYIDGEAYAGPNGVTVWPLPVHRAFPPPANYGGINSPAYGKALQACLHQAMAHFETKGWSAEPFVWSGPPPVPLPEPSERLVEFARRLSAASTPHRLLARAIPQSMKPFGWLGHETDPDVVKLVSIWAPPARFYDAPSMRAHRAAGKRGWMLPGEPSYSPSLAIGAPPVDARALAWQAYRLGIDRIFVPSVNDWPEGANLTVAPLGSDWLIYPGKAGGVEGVWPSVRLKRLRRGLQDLKYLALLQGAGQEDLARTIARILFRYGGSEAYVDHFADACQWPWVEQPELWDLARDIMGERIAKGGRGTDARSDEAIAETVRWRRLVDGACQIVLTCEGVRVRAAGGEAGASEVECHMIIRNERPQGLKGRLRFGDLPSGWKAIRDDVAVDELPCLGRTRVALVARATGIGTNEWGVSELPVVLATEAHGQIETQARLTQVTPRRLERPVVVDGDLGDWPPGIRNVAGDFVLISGRPIGAEAGASRGEPTEGTLAFVGYDRDRLLLALRCTESQPETLPQTAGNFIRYDGLVPADDDLVEILIDPTNAGTGQPIDVYHVMVRPTGAVLARHGVSTGSGWGESRHWPVDVRVVTQREPKAWTLEVSLPLTAFGAKPESGARWGFNVTRYQARVGEYSTWSGARRYAYNTRTFGNLSWP